MNLKNDELQDLYELFKKHGTLTYRQIAAKLHTYPATAKARCYKLRKMGVRLKPGRVREGERGPASFSWTLE